MVEPKIPDVYIVVDKDTGILIRKHNGDRFYVQRRAAEMIVERNSHMNLAIKKYELREVENVRT